MKTLALIFAILLLWCLPQTSQAAERTVLCEIFTSTTCPPCASANPVFDSWYNSYSLKNRVAVIKYHVWWPSPGNDPYYLANTQESRDRCYLLQPSSSMYVPRLYANGYNDGASNTST